MTYKCMCNTPGEPGYHSEDLCVDTNDRIRIVTKNPTDWRNKDVKTLIMDKDSYELYSYWVKYISRDPEEKERFIAFKVKARITT